MLGGRHGKKLTQHCAHGPAKTRAVAQSYAEHDIGQLAARRFASVVVGVESAAGIAARLFQRLGGWRHSRRSSRAAREASGLDVGLLDREFFVLELTELARRLVLLGIPLPARAGPILDDFACGIVFERANPLVVAGHFAASTPRWRGSLVRTADKNEPGRGAGLFRGLQDLQIGEEILKRGKV